MWNYNTSKTQKFQIDSTSNRIFKIAIEEYSFNHILDSIYQYERNRDDILINMKMVSEKGMTTEEFKKLLMEYDQNELQ